MFQLIPAPVHRLLLPAAHRIRHWWRMWRKAPVYGCSVVITDLGDQLLLLRHSYGPKVWALPGGGLKPNEDPEQAARREVMEELGIKLGKLRSLGTIEEVISGAPHTAHLFAASAAMHPVPDRREVVEARFFPLHSLPEPIGELTRRRLTIWRERSSSVS